MMKGIFVGLTTIDLQFQVDEFPKPNSKVKAKNPLFNLGGPATNAAITYAYLNGNANLYSGIGKTHFTNLIVNDLKNNNIILTDFIPRETIPPTIASIITNINNGDRTVFSYSPPNIDIELNTINENEIKTADIILLDGFYLQAAIHIAKIANKYNIPVVLDGGSWKDGLEILLKQVDFVICSNDFYAPGTLYKTEVIEYLKQFENIKNMAITRGNKSVIYIDDNKNYSEFRVPKVNTIDTLGAGDIFHGAFCYYYCNSKNFIEALYLASKIASKSCEYYGTREWMNSVK